MWQKSWSRLERCCRSAVCTRASWVTRTPLLYISSLCPLINSSWPLSLFPRPEGCSLCPYFLLLSFSSWLSFFRVGLFCLVLNEGTATLWCAVTNWHRGGRWWWGGDWLSCHLLQRHELISVPQSNHTCVILTLVTKYAWTHTPSELWHTCHPTPAFRPH